MNSKRKQEDQLCGPDCRYKALYQGSQSTLSDMVAKQIDALGRHQRVRKAVVHALKSTHPREFAQAEASLGQRIEQADDQVLMSLLTSFLQLQATPAPDGLDELRLALQHKGVKVPDDTDLTEWAKAVNGTGANSKPAGAPTAVSQTHQQSEPKELDAASTTGTSQPNPAGEPTSDVSGSRPSLRDLAKSSPSIATQPLEQAASGQPASFPPSRPAFQRSGGSTSTQNPVSGSLGVHQPATTPSPAASQLAQTQQPGAQTRPDTSRRDEGVDYAGFDGDEFDDGTDMPPLSDLSDLFEGDESQNSYEPRDPGGVETGEDETKQPFQPEARTPRETLPPRGPSGPTSDDSSFIDDAQPAADGSTLKAKPVRRKRRRSTRVQVQSPDDNSESNGVSNRPAKESPKHSPGPVADAQEVANGGQPDGEVGGITRKTSGGGQEDSENSKGESGQTTQGPAAGKTPWDPPDQEDKRIFSPLDNDLDSLFEPDNSIAVPPPSPESKTEPVVLAPSEQLDAANLTESPSTETEEKAENTPPLRPTLFPQSNKKAKSRNRRVSRVSANPPDSPPDIPTGEEPAQYAELTVDTRNALEAFVSLPRPVFTSDLVAAVGSQEVVAAWEDECHNMDQSPVRFIPPKKRHRLRGPLVIPYDLLREASSELADTWWADVMSKYRGGRVYELGVLLHRIGEQIISYRFDSNVALLRLNQPRGIVGVCVLVSNSLDEEDQARADMVEVVEELLRDRLDLLVVLTSYGDPVERLVKVLGEEATARGWQPSQPVVAAHTWEYADGNNSAFVHVIG